MLTAIVLICSVAVTPNLRACDQTNARVVMHVPELYPDTVACAKAGQIYAAGNSVGEALGPNDRLKVVCAPTRTSVPAEETQAKVP